MIKISADISQGDDLIKQLISVLTGPQKQEANSVGGRAATNAVAAYHRQFESEGRWRRAGGLVGDVKSGFGSEVADGWSFVSADSAGATISNDATAFAQKVYGGIITAKRVQFLTIPLVNEAKGRRARDYEIKFGHRLFTIPGRNALFEQTGANATESVLNRLYGRRKGGARVQVPARGGIRAVYALCRSVDQKPWPGALPPEELIASAFADGWRETIAKILG